MVENSTSNLLIMGSSSGNADQSVEDSLSLQILQVQ